MKTCRRCGQEKGGDDFYRHPKMADGTLNICKECVKRRVKVRRAENIDAARDYDRSRANRPDRVAARDAYAKTERGRERLSAGSKAWRKRNPEKYAAHVALNNAIRDGKVIKPDLCECRRPGKIHAHHDDYSKPLDVLWLCVRCHSDLHKERREAA